LILSFAVFYFFLCVTVAKIFEILAEERCFSSSPFDIIWLLDSFGKFFHNPLGFTGPMDGLAIVAFLAGCIPFPEVLFILLSPLFVTFFYLHKYPFSNRLCYF